MGPERTDLGSERADWGLRGAWGGDVRTDGRTYGRLEIHPCVLQDIGPLREQEKKKYRKLVE